MMARDFTKVQIDMKGADVAIKDLGLNRTGAVQQYATQRAKERMEQHVPRMDGGLIASAEAKYDEVIYRSPYARFQYFGKVMVDPETGSAWARRGAKKVVTERDLKYTDAPQRGSHWDQKMIADQGEQYYEEIQEFADKFKSK